MTGRALSPWRGLPSKGARRGAEVARRLDLACASWPFPPQSFPGGAAPGIPVRRSQGSRAVLARGRGDPPPPGGARAGQEAPCSHGESRSGGDGGWSRLFHFPDPPRTAPGRRRAPAAPCQAARQCSCGDAALASPRGASPWRGRPCAPRVPPPPLAHGRRARRRAARGRRPAALRPPRRAAPPLQWRAAPAGPRPRSAGPFWFLVAGPAAASPSRPRRHPAAPFGAGRAFPAAAAPFGGRGPAGGRVTFYSRASARRGVGP